MTLSVTERGSGGNNVAASTFTGVAPSGTIAAGSLGVLIITADNAGSGGATAVCPATITDSKGNVWTRRQNPIYDPGSAAAGVETACYTCLLTTALLSSDNANFTWAGSVSVTAKRFAFKEIISSTGTPAYRTGGAGTGAASGTPTVTTGSITSGEVVVGWGGSESADTWAGDADSTNGAWATHIHGASGTGTSGMSLTTQHKIVTATATQTYNPTLTSADQILGWIAIQEIPDVTGTGGVDVDAPAVAGSGKERMVGTSAADIDAPAIAATGKERFLGTGAVDVEAPAIAATGEVGAPAVTGTGASSFAAPAIGAAGLERMTGAGAVSIDAPTISSTGLEAIRGSGATSIVAPAIAATGLESLRGSGGVVLGPPGVIGAGKEAMTGAGSFTIAAPGLAGGGLLRIYGEGAMAIAAPLIAGSGVAGSAGVSGSGGVQFRAPSLEAFGLVIVAVSGAGGVLIRGPELVGVGSATMPAAPLDFGVGTVDLADFTRGGHRQRPSYGELAGFARLVRRLNPDRDDE